MQIFARSGLIKARLAGARIAQGDVMIFLDAHCECALGWLQPLLGRIEESPNAVVVPLIDVISSRTFEYEADGYGFDVISHYLPDSSASNRQLTFFYSFRLAVSRGMVTLIGMMSPNESVNDRKRSAKTKLKFVRRCRRQWPEDFSRSREIISGRLAVTTSRWTAGVERT